MMKYFKKILLLTLVLLGPLYPVDQLDLGVEEEFYSTKKKIRITDGIGKGSSKEIAYRNALLDARRKALVRVTSTFRHILSETKDGVFVDKTVWQDVHARIIDRERVISVTYDHGINFNTHVAIVDCEIAVSFLDLDFFATEIMKTAEAACVRSLFIAGWGQMFNRNYFAGAAMGMVTYGSLGYAYYREQQVGKAIENYNNASTPQEAERRYHELQNHRRVSRTLYVVGAMTYAYSVWEAFEDRERTDDVLDKVHAKFFPRFRYTRKYSPIQEFMMNNLRPGW